MSLLVGIWLSFFFFAISFLFTYRKPFSTALITTASTAIIILKAQKYQGGKDHLSTIEKTILSGGTISNYPLFITVLLQGPIFLSQIILFITELTLDF